MDYLSYILAILVIGLVCISVVRFVTRSQNPDLLMQYEARKKAARQLAADKPNKNAPIKNQPVLQVKSLRQRHQEMMENRIPWGWPGGQKGHVEPQGVTEAVRKFTDRLIKEKNLVESGGSHGHGSLRALLEDRYRPVDRGMTEFQYQKVKRPLLRDPGEQHDQLDNLGSVESRQLRQKLQLLSAMNNDEKEQGTIKGSKKVEFRYVELKDLKQPWGW